MSDHEVVSKLIKTHQKRAKNSLYWVAHKLLGFKDVNLKTHGEIIAALEDTESKRKLIVQPRGSLKSSLSCVAMLKARLRNSKWKLIDVKNILSLKDGAVGSGIKSNGVLEDKKTVQKRNDAKLYYVKYFTFKYYAENKQ